VITTTLAIRIRLRPPSVSSSAVGGAGDDVTPPSLSVAYEAAAKKLGKDVKLTQLEGVDHEALFDPAAFATVSQLVKP
jgi:hypothetical protein